ncbi:alpha/beta fold hydrolase [Kribbella sp. HUAS MG21]|uniref:alpha/beta fold hydrolase n=1 Tax=Kribbella sp. HUAS MG21 TaxID=3160966 RepID=UPI003305A015
MSRTSLTWGSGNRVVLLIHGMLGAATQFHQVGPALAERGYRALAVDLPGHGLAPPAPDATMEHFVDAVLDAVDAPPVMAIGHSLGAMVRCPASARSASYMSTYPSPAGPAHRPQPRNSGPVSRRRAPRAPRPSFERRVPNGSPRTAVSRLRPLRGSTSRRPCRSNART